MVSKAKEQQWQAEEDASTMASYQEIVNDKARMGRAIKVAKQRAEDLSKRASVMRNVAGASVRRGAARSGKRGKMHYF